VTYTARRCPNCGQYNYGKAEFCQACGEDISKESPAFIPWAQHHLLPPIASAVKEESRRFARVDPDAAGSGLVWTGLVVIAAGLLIDVPTQVLLLMVLGGAGIVVAGLWQLRIDYGALSRLGFWLVGVAMLALVVVAWRVLEPSTPNPVHLIQAKPTETPAAQAILVGDSTVPMQRGGPAHLGVNPGPPPTGTLFRSWRFDTGGELYSSPAVTRDMLVIGSKSGFLYGLNPVTGEQVWSRDLGQYIVRSTPAIQDDVVYVNNGYQTLALSLKDGATIWTVDISFAGNTSPTVDNTLVYVASQSGAIQALDAQTGKQRWRVQLEGLIFGSPTVDDGRVIVGNDSGTVYGLDVDNGQVDWRFKADGGVFAPLMSDDAVIYFTTNAGTTYAISATTGDQVWQYDAGGSTGGSVTLNEVIVGADSGGVSAIDRESGKIIWLVPTGAQIMTGPTIVGKIVVVASGQTLYGLDLATGAQVFTYATGYTIQIAPTIVNGVIYIGGRDGYLDAIVGDATKPSG
jgi:outer membrane protein assembly factor BamB